MLWSMSQGFLMPGPVAVLPQGDLEKGVKAVTDPEKVNVPAKNVDNSIKDMRSPKDFLDMLIKITQDFSACNRKLIKTVLNR